MSLWLVVLQLSCSLVYCQHLEWNRTEISNNSVIHFDNGLTVLKCYTENKYCCSSETGNWNWRDQTGEIVYQEPDGSNCLSFTRGDHVISLNRWSKTCVPPLSGLWRCDIPDSIGELQSLFIYIGASIAAG